MVSFNFYYIRRRLQRVLASLERPRGSLLRTAKYYGRLKLGLAVPKARRTPSGGKPPILAPPVRPDQSPLSLLLAPHPICVPADAPAIVVDRPLSFPAPYPNRDQSAISSIYAPPPVCLSVDALVSSRPNPVFGPRFEHTIGPTAQSLTPFIAVVQLLVVALICSWKALGLARSSDVHHQRTLDDTVDHVDLGISECLQDLLEIIKHSAGVVQDMQLAFGDFFAAPVVEKPTADQVTVSLEVEKLGAVEHVDDSKNEAQGDVKPASNRSGRKLGRRDREQLRRLGRKSRA